MYTTENLQKKRYIVITPNAFSHIFRAKNVTVLFWQYLCANFRLNFTIKIIFERIIPDTYYLQAFHI